MRSREAAQVPVVVLAETQRVRCRIDPALSLAPLRRALQNGRWPTTAPFGLSFTSK